MLFQPNGLFDKTASQHKSASNAQNKTSSPAFAGRSCARLCWHCGPPPSSAPARSALLAAAGCSTLLAAAACSALLAAACSTLLAAAGCSTAAVCSTLLAAARNSLVCELLEKVELVIFEVLADRRGRLVLGSRVLLPTCLPTYPSAYLPTYVTNTPY